MSETQENISIEKISKLLENENLYAMVFLKKENDGKFCQRSIGLST